MNCLRKHFDDAELLVLPGGMPGTLHLKEHKGLADLLCEFNENERKLQQSVLLRQYLEHWDC